MTDQKRFAESSGPDTVSKTVIGRSFRFDGNAQTEDDAVIEGQFTGKIEVGKTLVVERSGRVKAEIKAKMLRVFGKVEGNVSEAFKVSLMPDCEFSGDIRTRKIEIADGAIFNGSILMSNTPG
jgi:cytoskeletal protein CcmA (bactofilin family)